MLFAVNSVVHSPDTVVCVWVACSFFVCSVWCLLVCCLGLVFGGVGCWFLLCGLLECLVVLGLVVLCRCVQAGFGFSSVYFVDFNVGSCWLLV